MATTARNAAQQHQRGGGPSCTVCRHERREEFDKALVEGRASQADIAREIGCSPSIVSRHRKNHLLPKMKRQVDADPVLSEIDLVFELRSLFLRMKRHLDRAEEVDNWQAIRAFHSEARSDLETLARLAGEITEASTTVNVAIGSGWPEMRTAILRALQPFPDAKMAVVAALSELEGP